MTDQDQHRVNTNPYQPTLSGTAKPLKGIRWFRRFAILNGVLFLVPVVCTLATYFILEANGIWLSGVSGVMGTELAILLIAYLAIPNSIMVALWMSSRRSSRQQNGGN
jgi:antibiotic biosynthesis monooxygenase (ABM) superfamily enzyme